MKKRISLLALSIALIMLLVFSSMAIAAEPNKQLDTGVVLEQNTEITDLQQLEYMAENGITDMPASELPNDNTATLKVISSNENIDLETYTTTQVLKKTIDVNGQVETDIAVTTFVSIDNESLFLAAAASEQDREKYDTAGAVKAYSKIYYSMMTDSYGRRCFKLDSFNGGWINANPAGSGITVSAMSVQYTTTGIKANTLSDTISNQDRSVACGNLTFSMPTNFTFYAAESQYYFVGIVSKATVTVAGKSLKLDLENGIHY